MHPTAHVKWLVAEYLVAAGLCGVVVAWAGELSAMALRQGLVLATVFLLPAEALRQFGRQDVLQWFVRSATRAQSLPNAALTEEIRNLRQAAMTIGESLAQLHGSLESAVGSGDKISPALDRLLAESREIAEREQAETRKLRDSLRASIEALEAKSSTTQYQLAEVAASLEGIATSLWPLEGLARSIGSLEERLVSLERRARLPAVTSPLIHDTALRRERAADLAQAATRTQDLIKDFSVFISFPYISRESKALTALEADIRRFFSERPTQSLHEDWLTKELRVELPRYLVFHRWVSIVAPQQFPWREKRPFEEELERAIIYLTHRQNPVIMGS